MNFLHIETFDNIVRGDKMRETISNFFKINPDRIVIIGSIFLGILTNEQIDIIYSQLKSKS